MEAIIHVKSRTEVPNDSFESFIFLLFNEVTDIFDINDLNLYILSDLDFGENEISYLINQHLPTKSHIKKGQFTFDVDKNLMGLDINIVLSEEQIREIKKAIENNRLSTEKIK